MRNAARLVLAAAVAAAVLPSTSAHATNCGPKLVNMVCATVCRIAGEVDIQCVD